MSDEDRLYVLGELWQEDNEVRGALVCPNCTAQVFSGGWDGKLTAFESLCGGCDGTLLWFTTVIETDRYYQEHGNATADELRKFLTGWWDQRLREGITNERTTGYETDGLIESGEYAGRPFVKPVIREVDETEFYADEFQYFAEQFGWDWEPPEVVR